MAASDRSAKVFCIEGEWSSRLTDRRTVQPVLNLLEAVAHVHSVHQRVATLDALKLHVKRWRQRGYNAYSVGYFAFHGSPGCIHLGRRHVSLSELGEQLAGACRGRIIYFGSCETLAAKREAIDDFRERTGARAVLGFTKSVDWLESAGFEVLLFDAICHYKRVDAIEKWMRKQHPRMCDRLGFVMTYATTKSRAGANR